MLGIFHLAIFYEGHITYNNGHKTCRVLFSGLMLKQCKISCVEYKMAQLELCHVTTG